MTKIIFLLLFFVNFLYSKPLIRINNYYCTVLNSDSDFELKKKLKKERDGEIIYNFLNLVNINPKLHKKITLYKNKYNKHIRFMKIKTGKKKFNIYYIKTKNKYCIKSNDKKFNNFYINKSDLYNFNSTKKIALKMPLKYKYISSYYSLRRWHPILHRYLPHHGVDFVNKKNTPIRAAASGLIIKIGRNGSYGNYIEIKHKNNFYTEYAHLNKYNKRLKKGMKVRVGQVIGFLGNTGRSTGPHLHFGLKQGRKFLNPLLYIKGYNKYFKLLTKKNSYLKRNHLLNSNIRKISNSLEKIKTT